jgi:hypothetical protein
LGPVNLTRAFLATLVVATLAACAGNPRPLVSASATVEPDLSGVLRLFGRSGLAHGCPIDEGRRALTNAHVASDSRAPLIWDTVTGALGLVQWETADRFRDLAVITPQEGTFPRSYQIAEEAPQPGERVYFVGYDFRSRRQAFAPRTFEARVQRVLGGHIVFHPSGVPGTSGSCLLDSAGRVVGVNKGGKEIDGGMDEVGVAVGIWGSLLQLGSQ